jgi:hypothetical protein
MGKLCEALETAKTYIPFQGPNPICKKYKEDFKYEDDRTCCEKLEDIVSYRLETANLSAVVPKFGLLFKEPVEVEYEKET